MCLRRLEKADSFEVTKVKTSQEFSEFSKDMFGISSRSWKTKAEAHLSPDSSMGKMYLGFTPLGLDNNWVDMYVLKINEIPVCFEYLLTHNGNHCLTRCDFDESYRYYSPGNSLRLFVLKETMSDGSEHEYDLCGDDYCYKLDWTKSLRTHITMTVGNTSTVGKLVMTAKNVVLPYLRSCSKLFQSATTIE
jgi:hypothetical protein